MSYISSITLNIWIWEFYYAWLNIKLYKYKNNMFFSIFEIISFEAICCKFSLLLGHSSIIWALNEIAFAKVWNALIDLTPVICFHLGLLILLPLLGQEIISYLLLLRWSFGVFIGRVWHLSEIMRYLADDHEIIIRFVH